MVIFSQVKTYEDYFPYIDRRFNAMYYTFFCIIIYLYIRDLLSMQYIQRMSTQINISLFYNGHKRLVLLSCLDSKTVIYFFYFRFMFYTPLTVGSYLELMRMSP